MVWTSVSFEMKIILSISNAIFASPFAAGDLGHSSMRTGEVFLISNVSGLFPYCLHIIIAEDSETRNGSVTHPLKVIHPPVLSRCSICMEMSANTS